MCLHLCIKTRECCVNLFCKKILLLHKDDGVKSNCCLLFLLNIFYNLGFGCLIKMFNYDIVYTVDDLIFYDEKKKHQLIIPAILEYIHIDGKDETEIFEKYDNHVPFHIFVILEKISFDSKVIIVFRQLGKEKTNEFIVKDALDKRIFQLLK